MRLFFPGHRFEKRIRAIWHQLWLIHATHSCTLRVRVVAWNSLRYNAARSPAFAAFTLCSSVGLWIRQPINPSLLTWATWCEWELATTRIAWRPGGPLRLGGIDVPHDRQAIGHSDADVLLHALTDAILGAAARGDIGEHFPDTDSANRGRDSAEMLLEAYRLVRQCGFQIANVDGIVFAQRPKLGELKSAIRQRIADLLSLPLDRVNIKAKTGEHVGPVGREEAIMAECIVMLVRASER